MVESQIQASLPEYAVFGAFGSNEDAEITIQNSPNKRPAFVRLLFGPGDAVRLHSNSALLAATLADLRVLLETPQTEAEVTIDMRSEGMEVPR